MRIGDLRNLIAIQRLTGDQDELGQPVQTWVDVATVWADIRRLSGMESIRAGAETAVVKASIRIRFRNDVTAAMRAVHGMTVYEIKAVLPDEGKREYVDLTCEVING